jgi:acyl-CoA thioester hydrolase
MPRIRIDLPEAFGFATEVPVCIGHINYTQHLDNAQLLALVSEARLRYLTSLGYASELDIEGVGLVIADVAAQYRSEGKHGETLVIEMKAEDFNRYGCDFAWRVSDKASGREVARGKHGIVCFDYGVRKAVPMPAAFRAKAAA